MIRLGQSSDGRLIIGSNESFPADIRHVEYYMDQKMFMLVYENDESDLMPVEVTPETDAIIRSSPNALIVMMDEEGRKPYGYEVSLVQVGV